MDNNQEENEVQSSRLKNGAECAPSRPPGGTKTAIKDLGKKTRQRLNEEKSKRREIVRLEEDQATTAGDDKEAIGGTAFGKAVMKQGPKQQASAGTQPRRKRPRVTPALDKEEEYGGNHTVTSQAAAELDATSASEKQSNVILLYGIPHTCKPEDIVKFFSGLDPERILVLPSINVRIASWDDPLSRTLFQAPSEPILRVLVKFESAPLAQMALKRSVELLVTTSTDGNSKVATKIAISPVSKPEAQYLVNNLAIDCISPAGLSIYKSLVEIEKKLYPGITSLLWTIAIRDLQLAQDIQTNGTYPWLSHDWKQGNAHNFQGYQELVKLHNQFVEQYEKLEASVTCLLMEDYDPEVSRDPISRLTHFFASRLLDEIQSIDNRLSRARFQKSRLKE